MTRMLALVLLLAASSAYGEVFTWTDQRGTRHYTNSAYDIPARYRSRVKILDVPTGKKLTPTPAQLSGQSQSATPGQQVPAAASAPLAPPPPPAAPAQQVAPVQPAPAIQSERPSPRERREQRQQRQRMRSPSSEPEE